METEKRPKSEVNLRKLMQKMGLGTNAFAEACGMSSQSMAQFLRNKSLTTASIYRIAMALDIDPRDMFFPTDEEETTLSFSDKEKEEKKENTQEDTQPIVNTTAFCPHCGAKVRVGVVLLPEA
jgi:transcriptional regulator with XRE-family HTH domain